MKLVIESGKKYFWQWDLDQKLLVVGDCTCNEIHFCNDLSDKALIVEIKEHDGVKKVDVPNILLQTNRPITAYFCVEGPCETKAAQQFRVHPRVKPDDYIYTETEVKTWESLAERVQALEHSATHGTVTSVNGINPDENGNVQVEIPEGFSGSWDDLKDKPFGDIPNIILEETTFTTQYNKIDNDAWYLEIGGNNLRNTIVSGETYVVTVNDKAYECVANNDGYSLTLGNKWLSNAGSEKTGEPFCFNWDIQDEAYDYLYFENQGTYRIRIVDQIPRVMPLDEKYIPETIARVEDIPECKVKTVNGNVPDENGNVQIDIPETADDVGAVSTTGKGHIKHDQAEVFTVEDTGTSESVYMSYRAKGGYRATQGYHNNMAYIANERAGGARIGVNDQKEPEYRTGTQASTAKTLLHTGNAEEKLGLTYTDAPIPFAEQKCGSPCNASVWVTEYAYQKGYVQHIKTRVMEGRTGVAITACIFKAHDMTLLRKYTTTADAGEVVIPVNEYIGCEFYIGLVGEGLDFKSFKYGTYPFSYIACGRATYLDPLSEGDILNRTFTEMTDDKGSYVVAQEVTYNGRYNTSAPHTYTRNKMFAAGDSITAGYPTYTDGIHWWETVGRTLGYEVTRGAQNGNGFAYLTSPTSSNACVIANNTDFKLYDVAVFAFGTNDYGNNIAMGTIDDAPNHVTDNTGTFYAAVKYVVEKVLTSNPTCMLIFALPINRSTHGTLESNWAFGTKNTAGHTLSEYCDAIIAVCDKYGIPYIDRRHGIVNAYTVKTLMCDNLHPTDEGYKLLGMELSARIGALIRPYAEYNGTT